MIKDKDYDVIDFLTMFKVAGIDTLTELFYGNPRTARHRLKILYDNKMVGRSRSSVTNQYIYYIKKQPAQLRHSLLITDFYRELHKYTSSIAFFTKEPNLNGKKPDAVFGYRKNGSECIGLLEVEISNKGFDNEKYSDLSFCKMFPYSPKLFIISNKSKVNTKGMKIDYVILDIEMSNLKNVV